MNFSRVNPYQSNHDMDDRYQQDMTNNDNITSTNFPTLPPSLSAGDYGTRRDYAAQGVPEGVPRDAQHSLETIKPYLGLRSRLSQIWVGAFLIILTIMFLVLLSLSGIRDSIEDARDNALAACRTVETVGSNMASMPHYLGDGVNELAAQSITATVGGLRTVLFDLLTAAEALFVFWVNSNYGMYECLITFAVSSSLHGVVEFGTDANNFLNSSVPKIGDDISSALSGFNNDLNGFLKQINNLGNFFSGKNTPPATLDLSSEIDALKNLKLPTGVSDDLQKLNNSIPNFDQVRNFTNTVLKTPFEKVKGLMNDSIGNYKFDKTVLPLPERTQLSFCSDNDGINDFFDGVQETANVLEKALIGALVVAALLALVARAFYEISVWKLLQGVARTLGKGVAVDDIDRVYIAASPICAHIGLKLSSKIRSQKGRALVRWLFAYLTTTPALVLLGLTISALATCLLQYIVLKTIERKVPELSANVDAYGDQVVDVLRNVSANWSKAANTVIGDKQNQLNGDVLGWVNTTTGAVNDTLNTFVDKTMEVLNGTFGGTLLYEPILGVYTCLIGLKVESVQKGLTWVSDHAHIDFPNFPNDTFSSGADAALSTNKTTADGQNNSFLADPSDTAGDKITQVVTRLTNSMSKKLHRETLIAIGLLGCYLLLVLLGVGRVIYSSIRNGKARGEGGVSYAGDVAPGMAEDNTNQLAVNRTGDGYEMTSSTRAPPDQRFSQAASVATDTAAATGGRQFDHTNMPPPVYEPRRRDNSPSSRRPNFQSAFASEEEAEDAYQNEKMGFTNTGSGSVQRSGHARQSSYGEVVGNATGRSNNSNNPFVDQHDEKKGYF